VKDEVLLKNRIILASASPRRSEILSKAGIMAEVIPSCIKEDIIPGEGPQGHVLRLSREKALDVADKLDSGRAAWVLGADTVVVAGTSILGKPGNAENAKAMLRELSGKEHGVLTGYCLVNALTRKTVTGAARTKVKLKRLTEEEIAWYVSSGEPMDKAGAYAIQGIGSFMVERINGSYTNVVGLPLCQVVNDLEKVLPELKIRDVWTDFKKYVQYPKSFTKFKKEIINKKILRTERKGKNILIHLSGNTTLLVHQKMTGHLLYGKWQLKNEEWKSAIPGPLREDKENRFIHLLFFLSNGRQLALCDMRKFAKVLLWDTDKLTELKDIKENPQHCLSGLVNTGAYVLDERIFDYEPVVLPNGELGLPQTIVKMARDFPVALEKATLWYPLSFPENSYIGYYFNIIIRYNFFLNSMTY